MLHEFKQVHSLMFGFPDLNFTELTGPKALDSILDKIYKTFDYNGEKIVTFLRYAYGLKVTNDISQALSETVLTDEDKQNLDISNEIIYGSKDYAGTYQDLGKLVSLSKDLNDLIK